MDTIDYSRVATTACLSHYLLSWVLFEFHLVETFIIYRRYLLTFVLSYRAQINVISIQKHLWLDYYLHYIQKWLDFWCWILSALLHRSTVSVPEGLNSVSDMLRLFPMRCNTKKEKKIISFRGMLRGYYERKTKNGKSSDDFFYSP